MERFEDKNLEIYDFMDKILIVCPTCFQKAFVLGSLEIPKLICPECGEQRLHHSPNRATSVGEPFDPFFGIKLYLQINCCGEILFAFNTHHLQYLKQFVSSKLRERNKSKTQLIKNRSMVSRLPQWMKSSKNRDDILKKITVLEKKVTTS